MSAILYFTVIKIGKCLVYLASRIKFSEKVILYSNKCIPTYNTYMLSILINFKQIIKYKKNHYFKLINL